MAEFRQEPPANSARRDRRLEIADDGNRAEFALALGHGGEDRGAFGAIRGAIGGVFDIAAVNDCAVVREQRGADEEFGVGRVGTLTSLEGRIKQLRLGRRERFFSTAGIDRCKK